jgi:hypothetical protein
MISLLCALLLLQAQGKAPLPKDESTLVKVADQAKLPSLALDADGNAYVAFVRNGNIELAISTDGGKTFGAPVTAVGAGGRDAAIPNRGPRVCVDKQKRIFVSAPLCTAPPSSAVINDLYFAVSSDKGKTFSKPFMINESAGTASESVHAAAAGAGDLHAAWLDSKSAKGRSLLYAKFDAQGKRSGKIVVITGFACENCPPGIAVDPAGNPSVAWREGPREPGAQGNRQIFLSRSTDGGKSFAAPAQLNSLDSGLTECPHEAPAVASSADGKVLAAAWMDRRDLEHDANIYWSFGPPGKFGRDTDCHDDRRYIQRRPALAIDADGVIWCAWEDARLSTQRVFFTHSKTESNIPLGDAKEGGGSSPSLASNGGKVAIAYQFGDGVGFRVLATK